VVDVGRVAENFSEEFLKFREKCPHKLKGAEFDDMCNYTVKGSGECAVECTEPCGPFLVWLEKKKKNASN
jgi:hypothetical protein